jgi:FkbM family methyltransferase
LNLVSVVIPCFNARNSIRATLQSVVEQGISDLEVIVVDDGSTDGGPDLVTGEFPQVQVVRRERGGPSAARNVGTRCSSSEFIQYVDADDLLAEGKLRQQLQVLTETGADVAYGDWRELHRTPRGGLARGRLIERHIEGEPEIALFTDFWCPPAVYLFRRTIVDAVGGWRESLPIIQDARFALDCALHGGQFVYCPGVAAYYRVHDNGSVSTRDPREFARDCLRNGLSVERWWDQHGGVSAARKAALIQVHSRVARTSFASDRDTFDAACQALERLQPGYLPQGPRTLRLLARVAGYRRAEAIAARYRSTKRQLNVIRVWLPQRHASALRWLAGCAYRLPGVNAMARRGLRLVLLRSHLSPHTKQQLHNFFAVDVAPPGSARFGVKVPGRRPIRLRLRVRDDLTRYWYFWGYAHYELGTTRLLSSLLRKKRTFFDVGANVGYHTFLAAALLEGKGTVHAFEPWSAVYEDLAASARLNAFRCLSLNQMALSDCDGEGRLYLPGSSWWTTASLLNEDTADRYETVPMERFDSYCARRGVDRVDLVKIDVEGAELQVLRGMGGLLDAWRPDIVLEVLEPFQAELDRFFSPTGYRKFRIRDNGLEELERITAQPHDRNVYLSYEPELEWE